MKPKADPHSIQHFRMPLNWGPLLKYTNAPNSNASATLCVTVQIILYELAYVTTYSSVCDYLQQRM